ncbi:MAG: hypothetical protein FWG10_04490 [Eubacteriaceae bacterium]|nr:hypothetical protein [Eubacteriaceae bacterium]
MKRQHFVAICALLSIAAIAAALVMPILTMRLTSHLVYDTTFQNTLINEGRLVVSDSTLMLYVPIVIGVVALVACFMKGKVFKTVMSIVAAASMYFAVNMSMATTEQLITTMFGEDLKEMFSGATEFASQFLGSEWVVSAVQDIAQRLSITYGYGFYLFIGLFVLASLLHMVSPTKR